MGAIPGDALHRELELIAAAGASNFDTLRTATTVPASYFKRSERIGTVEAGKLADLVLLDANPLASVEAWSRIDKVILHGEPIERESLDAD